MATAGGPTRIAGGIFRRPGSQEHKASGYPAAPIVDGRRAEPPGTCTRAEPIPQRGRNSIHQDFIRRRRPVTRGSSTRKGSRRNPFPPGPSVRFRRCVEEAIASMPTARPLGRAQLFPKKPLSIFQREYPPLASLLFYTIQD